MSDWMTAAREKGKVYKMAARPAVTYDLEMVALPPWMEKITNEYIRGTTGEDDEQVEMIWTCPEEEYWICWKNWRFKEEEGRKSSLM